jgi:hypothetical protein
MSICVGQGINNRLEVPHLIGLFANRGWCIEAAPDNQP